MTSATKNSFWYLTFNLSRLLVLFFGSIWISKSLGPEAFGQFSYFLSVIIYISAIDSLCHESIVKQYLSKKEDIGLVLGSAAALNSILSMVSITVIVLFGFLSVNDPAYLAVFLLFLPGQFSKAWNPIANYFDIQLLSKYSSLALFIGASLSILFRTIAVNFSKDLSYQTFGYSLQTIFYAGVLYFFYRRHSPPIKWQVSLKLVGQMAKRSLPLLLSAVVFLTLSQSDIFMIKHFLGVRDVGIYSIVVKLSEPWVIISSAMCTSFFPLIFAQNANVHKQEKYYVRANQLSIYFVLILGLFLYFTIDFIVSLLLGEQYQAVGGIFKIYFWGILFYFFANIQHMWEVFHGKYSIALYKTAAACALKICSNYFLGPIFGLKGFAFATLISLSFYGFGFNLISKTTRPYLPLQVKAFGWHGFKVNCRFIIGRGKQWLSRKY